MKANLLHLRKNSRFRLFIGIVTALFFYKIFLIKNESLVTSFIGELLILCTIITLTFYLTEIIRSRKINPLSVVLNIGILNAVLFFIITFSGDLLSGLFGNIEAKLNRPGLFFSIILFAYVLFVIVSVSYIFLSFRELFYFKQKRNVSVYFNTMVVFFVLASLTTILDSNADLSFISNTFLIVSIILVSINSIRISWIAFIIKKEKISLLILSVIISALFIVNLVNSNDANSHTKLLSAYSPALSKFLQIILIYGAVYFSVLFFTTLFHIPTAEAFDRKAQEVSSLQFFSKLITRVLDFSELGETVADLAIRICNAHSAWVIWNDGGELKTLSYKNIGYVDAELITNFFLSTKRKGDINSTVTLNLAKIENRESLNEKYNQASVSPLKTHNEIKGYLITLKKDDQIFDEEDKNALDTFADYASVAFENSRLLEESIEKERMERELDVAREIQRKILPSQNPYYKGILISSVFIPAFEVGGDYYDFFNISQNKMGFVIADVSGKGISAAFIMAEMKGVFESLSHTISSPKNILVKANHILKNSLDKKSFISAAYGVIDLDDGVLTLARAGHCPVLLIRNGNVERLRPSGIGLGLDFTANFEMQLDEIKIELNENDLLILYTDGITEAKNSEMEDFGENHFEKILIENADHDLDIISNKVIKEITLFSTNNSQHDDISLVILKWKKQFIKNESGSLPGLNKMEKKNVGI
ncbi:MAG: SpoIIE family protein phosphatase [Ignavibacteriales bacterium]|nr:MAG: SpoIIE family protein phosphatase [Ignavibacteriales bacterium]